MGHFCQDRKNNWKFKVCGQNKKVREVCIPTEFLPFLERYRISRGLFGLPSPNENNAIVEKTRGSGGMTSRHIRRIIKETYDYSNKASTSYHLNTSATKTSSASPRWLKYS